jgi:hypothetical protein
LDIYIGILLGAHPILHISRIRVKYIIQYYIYILCLDLPRDFCASGRRDITNVLALHGHCMGAYSLNI